MSTPLLGQDAINAGIAAGNINFAKPGEVKELQDLSDTSREAQQRHAQLLLKLEAQRRARFLAAPTDPEEVKSKLRELGHPITLFGEGPADRRERLKFLLGEIEVQKAIEAEGLAAVTSAAADAQAAYQPGASASASAPGTVAAGITAAANAADQKPELFYTPASAALVDARKEIASFSFERAKSRIQAQNAVASDQNACSAEDARASKLYSTLRKMRPNLSQVADERPLTACALTSDGALMATSSWGSVIRIWNPQNAKQLVSLKGHKDRVVGVAWHPAAGLPTSSSSGKSSGNIGSPASASAASSRNGLMVSGSADGTARLWRVPVHALASYYGSPSSAGADSDDVSMSDGGGGSAASNSGDGNIQLAAHSANGVNAQSLIESGIKETAVLSGHAARLSSVAFHPSGRYVGTTSFDKTWRLWDVETAQEVLLQEGHAREVYPIAFHPDGSLVATGDLSGLGRVWDLRSGKFIFMLRGHSKQMMALDWSPNGYYVASGSDDHSSIIWELRQQRTLYTIPAHAGLISRVKFAPVSGEYLATASFDGTVKLWSARDWSPISTLAGHDGKVTGLDIFPDDETHLVTTAFDRTFKTWAHESEF